MIQSTLRYLAEVFDIPNFPWKKLVVLFSLGQFTLENWLLYRQYRVYKRTECPVAIRREIDGETFQKSQAYSRAKAKFSVFTSIIGECKSIAVLYYDIFPKAWSWTGSVIATHFPTRFSGEISHSLLFMFGFSIFDTLLGLPMDYYRHFVLEEKFGFNKMTIGLWITDMLKGIALSVAIGAPVGAAFLAIVRQTGQSFFYYLWAFMVVFQLVAITVYPILIVPIFNKLTPLKPGELKENVEALCRRLSFPLDELQVIDGSKRSAHSNAYFTGLPWKKRIVIFDTLLEQSTNYEVEAVLAHELGHWKMGHTSRMLLSRQAHLFYVLALWSSFIDNKSLYASFGFSNQRPIVIGFLLFSMIYSPVDTVVEFLMNMFTRRMEYQADAFAAQLGYTDGLARSLIKLQIKNLSSMDADWLYSAFHHSHPILTERLKALNWTSEGDSSDQKSQNKTPYKKDDASEAFTSGREL